MKIDRYASAEENVFLLIEEANPGLDLNDENVTLGTPTPYDGSATDDDTVITVTAIPNKGFSGHRDVTYNRLTLEEAIGSQVYPDLFALSQGSSEAQIRQSLCSAVGLVEDGGLLITDENGATVAVPASGQLKMALVDVLSNSLLYNERAEPLPLILTDLPPQHLLINPKGTTVYGLELFTAFGSPTEAGNFIYINRGQVVGTASGTQTGAVRLASPFPAGSKIFIINEGRITGTSASAVGGPTSILRAAFIIGSDGAAQIEVQNPTGLIEAPGGTGEWYQLLDSSNNATWNLPGGTGTGYRRSSTPLVASGSIAAVSVEAVQGMTQGDFDTPGRGGIYNVTIRNDSTGDTVTGQVITGAGGTAGHHGGTASYTGFENLATLFPTITLNKMTPAIVSAINDPGALLTMKSGTDSDHFKDMVV